MQNAETVLGVLRERGRRGLPCDELYRQLFNPQLYLLAYGRIYSNQGAMTPGVTQETADGMSLAKIGAIIDAMRHERYRFAPVRRIYIRKKNGKMRPLGLPTWSDKLVGEVVRLLLEAYYEPTFSDRSHGFRPGRGCHTALREVANTWTGTTWFIEGDISDCFGSLDHSVMIKILAEKIHDNRFLRLMRNMLEAGYLEDWSWNATLSGCPQGGVVSPVLSNIYLHKLDEYVETVLIPQYTRGDVQEAQPCIYQGEESPGVCAQARRPGQGPGPAPTDAQPAQRGSPRSRLPAAALLTLRRRPAPRDSSDPRPKPRRSKTSWRRSCVTNSRWNSADKTLITHARTRAARFLGYEIIAQHGDSKITAASDRSTGRSRCACHSM